MKKIILFVFWSSLVFSQDIAVWGWRTSIWSKFFQKEYNLKVEILNLDENGRMPVKEFKKYKLVILCQGSIKEKLNDEEIEEVKNYLSSGGKILIFSGTISALFSKNTAYDIERANEIIGAKRYLYAKFKGEVMVKNSPLFKDIEFDDYPWLYDQPSLTDITDGKVILGNKVGGKLAAKVLINKVENGFLLYISPVAIAYYKDDWDKDPISLNMIKFLKNVINMCLKNEPSLDEVIKYTYKKKENPFLIKNKTPKVIVKAGENEKKIAEEFVKLLNIITGSEITVENESKEKDVFNVYIGRHKDLEKFKISFENLHPYGYFIKIIDNNLIISGKLPQGTSYGIWDFFKRFTGYRDFGHTEIYKIIPKFEYIKLPEKIDIKEEPSFLTWTNAGFYGGNGSFYRSWRTTLLASHNLYKIFPPEKYAKTHPEYYPMIGGKRFVPPEKMDGTWQPCVSNPELIPIVMEYAKEYFLKNPHMIGLPVGVNDGGGDCQCPECLKLKEKYGNQYIPFYNEIAKNLKKDFPDKLVSFIAYGRICSVVPKNMKLEPNIYVEIASGLRNNMEEFKKWKEAGAKNIGLYDYLYGISGYVVPRHYPHIIGNALKKAYKEYGLKGGWIESFITVWLYDGPKQYVLNELAWDINKDIDELLNDYFSNFYKESAKPMREFFDRIEEIYGRKKDPLHPIDDWQNLTQFDEYKWEDLDYLDRKLNDAKNLAKSQDIINKINLFSKIWDLSRLYIESYLHYKDLRNFKKMQDEKEISLLLEKSIDGLKKWQDIENYKMTEDEEKNIFVNTNLEKFINQQTLKVKPFLENEIVRVFSILTEYLEKKYGWEKAKNMLLEFSKKSEEIKPYLLSQIYMKECEESKKNLIANSGFEPDEKEEEIPEEQLKKFEWKQISKKLKGWTTWHFQQSVTTFYWDREEKHTGNYSFSIRENQIAGCLQTSIKVEPNCIYKLSFWVKQKPPDKGGNLMIRWMDKEGWADQGEKKAPRIIVPYPVEKESKWRKVDFIFTCPENVTTCVPLFGAPRQESDEGIWFDDVEMYKIYDPKYFEKMTLK